MEFSQFEHKTIQGIEGCRGAIKNCGRNSILHLEKASAIRDLDIEMAFFRGITAEEEAASALFYCLKNHKYQNSKRILFKEHTYKLGLYPFLLGIGAFLDETLQHDSSPFDKFYLNHIETNGRQAIELLLNMPKQKVTARPVPPLNFTVSESYTGEVCTFENNFNELVNGAGFDDVLKYVKDVATTRNKILYADSSGRPRVEGDIVSYLNHQKRKVMAFLNIVLMIDPWEKNNGTSLFVQQALDSFLLVLNRIKADDVYQPNH
ncbi:hypothetical protein ACLD02_06025 [Alloalcanivorax sp. C16-2]|uniref:hypothetical protein n=1 Tax=Alloalcanivorax sp. C16-2 TaxID=3390052 RepID=UPI0039706DF8